MATSTQSLVRDSSTLANYKQWAKAISDFFITAGWTRSGDSGQVNWSTIATVPANSLTRDYDIFQPGDGLQTFYVKVRYGTGNGSTNTSPSFDIQIGTATNGAGTLSGFLTTAQLYNGNNNSVTSTSVQWQCHFSGDSGRICIMMWRDETSNNGPCVFVIQRSLNSSGTAYGTSTTGYVTIAGCENAGNSYAAQQSLLFGVGPGNAVSFSSSGSNRFYALKGESVSSELFNGAVPFSPIFPNVGFFDNPMDALAVGAKNDFSEGAQYSIPSGQMPYGVTHNYIAGKNSPFNQCMRQNNDSCILMRYD